MCDLADLGDLQLPPPVSSRGRSGTWNEQGMTELFEATRETTLSAIANRRRLVLVGGDCSMLLGPLCALRDALGDCALVMYDGHEDVWPPAMSASGKNSELALALGYIRQLPPALQRADGMLSPEQLALLGPRDAQQLRQHGILSLRRRVALFASDSELRQDPVGRGYTARAALAGGPFWLHIDLDVLRLDEFASVDRLQPGGVSWLELLASASAIWSDERCVGLSVARYVPALDSRLRDARRLCAFLAQLLDL